MYMTHTSNNKYKKYCILVNLYWYKRNNLPDDAIHNHNDNQCLGISLLLSLSQALILIFLYNLPFRHSCSLLCTTTSYTKSHTLAVFILIVTLTAIVNH